jgi:outer membrane protein assembly factor BamB
VQLPTDRVARQRLEAVAEYVEAQRWTEATRLLQALLDNREDVFVPLEFKDGKPVRSGSARAEAERLLSTMSADGLDVYRATQAGVARRLLKQARDNRDLKTLEEVVRRYRYTAAGTEALTLLGTYQFDRGRADLAAACFRRLLEAREELPAKTLFLAALAFQGNGERRSCDRAWTQLSKRVPKGGLAIGNHVLDRDQLKEAIDHWPTAEAPPSGALWRGDARRSVVMAGDVPLLEPRWQFLDSTKKATNLLNRALQLLPKEAPLMPGGVPIFRNGLVYYRSPSGVHAVDAVTGREQWRTSSPLGLGALLADPGRGVQLEHWFSSYLTTINGTREASAVLLENSVPGTLSADARHIYLVEDLALPPNPNLLDETLTGRKPLLGPMRHLIGHNRLRALDGRTGRPVWELGGQGIDARPPELADSFFLGPPLPLGGRLLVLVDKGTKLYLVTLDPERGEVIAMEKLATLLRSKLVMDVPRRVQAVHLAYEGGVLVCSTNAGVVLGLDALTHNLLWAHLYRDHPTPAPPEGAPPFNPDEYHKGWKASGAIIHQGRVLFTAPDSDDVRCLNLQTGSLVWKSPRSQDDVYLAGAFGDRVLIVGRGACRALTLSGGRQVWQHSTGTPSGQGVAAGPYYYLPLKEGAIVALHVAAPKLSMRIPCRDGGAPGNLLFAGDGLWSQTALSLTAYPQLEPTLKRLSDRLAQKPNDLDALSERGLLRLHKGDVSGAAADIKAALALKPPAERAGHLRESLFDTLTQLLERDFAAAEKYLDEYRALCRLDVPADAAPAESARLAAEQRRRFLRYHILVARGREAQGRLDEAVDAHRDVLDVAAPNEWMTPPGDLGVRCRPDVWVRGQMVEMAARLTPEQRQHLAERVEREGKSVTRDRPWQQFLALYGGLDGDAGRAVREARFRMVEKVIDDYHAHRAITADLVLHEMEQDATPSDTARILETRARLLCRYGMPEDAADCLRRLRASFGTVVLPDGKTGARRWNEAQTDRRLLPYLESDTPAWEGHTCRATRVRGSFEHRPNLLIRLGDGTLESNDGLLTEAAHPDRPHAGRLLAPLPPSLRDLRLEVARIETRARLQASHANGIDTWSLPVPVGLSGTNILLHGKLFWRPVGHLAILALGQRIVAVDLIDRCVRWSIALDELAGPGGAATFWLQSSGVYILGRSRLTAFDVTTGKPRWVRADAPIYNRLYEDQGILYLEEPLVNTVRAVWAVRADDGTRVTIPEGGPICDRRLAGAGRHVLALDRGPRNEVVLRWHDLQTGKDLWTKQFPEKTLLPVSTVPGTYAVITPEGDGVILDLDKGRELARLHIDARYLEKVHQAHLLADRERYYLAFIETRDAASPILNGPHSNFNAALGFTIAVDRLDAFDRAGKFCWHKSMPNQMLLLHRFDELPVILCSAVVTRLPGVGKNPVRMVATRTLEKRTGKLCHDLEGPFNGETITSLLVDRHQGTVDLLMPSVKLRHLPQR